MNKSETIDQIARSADIPKAAAKLALDALETHIKAHIDAGERVLLRGLGSFSRGAPAQKAGRNPRDMDRLQSKIPSELRYSLHVNMISLGREICTASAPKCEECPIAAWCCPRIGVTRGRRKGKQGAK